MTQIPSNSNKAVCAALAFFLGAFGADFFYRREFLAGFAIIAALIFSYALLPVVGAGVAGLVRAIPMILFLYGVVRAVMYTRSKGL